MSYDIGSACRMIKQENQTNLKEMTKIIYSTKKFEPFTITASDVATEGRAGKLVYGEKVTPYELLFPLLIGRPSQEGFRTMGRSRAQDGPCVFAFGRDVGIWSMRPMGP